MLFNFYREGSGRAFPKKKKKMDLHSRIGKTTAVAGRIAKLMESMHSKLEVVEADKEKLQQQLEKEEKIEIIAAKMREEANRIKHKEQELSRREQHLKQREFEQREHITVHKVRELYLRIEEQGEGIATKSSLLRCLRTDEDLRSVFCGDGLTAENLTVALEKIFSNTDPQQERVITYDEFSLAVLGPGHPSLIQSSRFESSPPLLSGPGGGSHQKQIEVYNTSMTSPRSGCRDSLEQPRQRSRSESQYEALNDQTERSPPPFRLPDLSPMMQSPPKCHEPTPPPAFNSVKSVNVIPVAPPHSNCFEASQPVQSNTDSPFLCSSENPFLVDVVSESDMFTDSQFPPEGSSFAPNPSDGLLWQRTSGGSLFPKTPQCSSVIAGVCSNRKWLSAMCLIADPHETIGSGTSTERGYAEVIINGTTVAVDNYFPSIHGCPAHVSTPSQLWIMFAEKALAKAKGGYSFLERSRYEKLSELIPIVRSGAQAATFPMEMDSLMDLVESVAASHLQLLTPRPSAASRLDDIGSLYSIFDLYPKNETDITNCFVLIFSPVISQGVHDAPDAKWVKATDLLQLFSTWTLVDVNNTFLKRRQSKIDLPRHPDIAINRLSPIPEKCSAFSSSTTCEFGESMWGQLSDIEAAPFASKSEGRESIERCEPASSVESQCDTKESEVDERTTTGSEKQFSESPSPTTQITNWKEQTKHSQRSSSGRSSLTRSPSEKQSVESAYSALPKPEPVPPTTATVSNNIRPQSSGWNETLSMVLSSNTAVMKEVQAHKADAEEARTLLEVERVATKQQQSVLNESKKNNHLLKEEVSTLQSILTEKQFQETECNIALDHLGYDSGMTLQSKVSHVVKRLEESSSKARKLEEKIIEFENVKSKLKAEYETAFEVQQDRVKESEGEKLKIAKTLFAERESTAQLRDKAAESENFERELTEQMESNQKLQQRIQNLEIELIESSSNTRTLEKKLSEPSSDVLTLKSQISSLEIELATITESQRVFEYELQQDADNRIGQVQSNLRDVISELQSDLQTSKLAGQELDTQLHDSRKQASALEMELSKREDDHEMQLSELQSRIKQAMEGFASEKQLRNEIREKDEIISELKSKNNSDQESIENRSPQHVEVHLAAEVRIRNLENEFDAERRFLKNQIAELDERSSSQQRDLEVQNAINNQQEPTTMSALQQDLKTQQDLVRTLSDQLQSSQSLQQDFESQKKLIRSLQDELSFADSLKQQLESHHSVIDEQASQIAKLQNRSDCDNCKTFSLKMKILEEEIERAEGSSVQKQREITQITEWMQQQSDATHQRRITESEERVAILQENVDNTIRKCDTSAKEHSLLREQILFLERQLDVQNKNHSSEVLSLTTKLKTHEEEIPKLNKQLQDIISLHSELGKKHLRVASEVEERKRSERTSSPEVLFLFFFFFLLHFQILPTPNPFY